MIKLNLVLLFISRVFFTFFFWDNHHFQVSTGPGVIKTENYRFWVTFLLAFVTEIFQIVDVRLAFVMRIIDISYNVSIYSFLTIVPVLQSLIYLGLCFFNDRTLKRGIPSITKDYVPTRDTSTLITNAWEGTLLFFGGESAQKRVEMRREQYKDQKACCSAAKRFQGLLEYALEQKERNKRAAQTEGIINSDPSRGWESINKSKSPTPYPDTPKVLPAFATKNTSPIRNNDATDNEEQLNFGKSGRRRGRK